MAESSTTNELQKPAGAAGVAPEPVIHVIPDEFYGAALKKKVKPEPKNKPEETAKPPAAPTTQSGPATAKSQRKGGNGALIAILTILLVLLLGGGAAAYYFLVVKPKSEVKKSPIPVVNVPTTSCGDSKCDANETVQSCPADCKPPTPTCGDSKCETGETAESCAVDCAPKVVCGNGQCEEGENSENCSEDCESPKPQPAADSDNDGLSDVEETAIYGTDPKNMDSDHDSFLDLNEIISLFDPAKPRPSMLVDNPGIDLLTNDSQGYEVLYPSSFTVRRVGETDSEVYFTAPGGEFIEILVEDKPAGKTLMDWYLEKVPNLKSSEVQVFRTRNGYDEILSEDHMTAFISAGGKIFVVSYNLADSKEIRYRATFSTVISSLKVK